MADLDKIYERAKFARTNAGLSTKQASELAQIRHQWLEAFEKGETSYTPDTLVCLAKIYAVSRDWLVFGTERSLSANEKQMIQSLPKGQQFLMRNILKSLPVTDIAPAQLRPIICAD